MITNKDYKIIEARCTYDSNGNHDIEYVVIEYQRKLYIGQSDKSQHEALENAIRGITQQEKKDKLLDKAYEKNGCDKVEINKILGLIKKIRYTEVDYQTRVNDECEEDLDLLVELLEPLNKSN